MRRHLLVLAGGSIAICLAMSLLVAGTASALSTGNGGWQWQNPLPQGNAYTGGYFLDASHGWLISGGVIFHTSDGGARLTVEARHDVSFRAITFVGSRHGWAVGYPAAEGGTVIVYRTVNGGRSWTHVRVARVGGINDVSFATTTAGWATAGRAVLQTVDGGLTWTVHTMRAHDTMHGVQALTARRVYAAAGGALLRSVDGGATWQRLTVGALKRVGRVSFTNLRNGWVGGTRGIVHTTDGGAHWTLQLATGRTVNSLDTIGPHNGWATIGGVVYHTTDGGAQWLPQATAPFAAWVTALGPASAAIGTSPVNPDPFSGGLSRTTDGGATWQPSTSAAGDYYGDLSALQFVNATSGWAAGSGGEILATTNGGATWTAQSSNTTEDLNGVHFADAADGWAVGDQGTIVHTSDGGATWTAQSSGTSYQLTGVTFTDVQNGWATGQTFTPYDNYSSGVILHTTDGGQHWTTQYASTFDENTLTVGIAFSAVAFTDPQDGWAAGETKGSDLSYNHCTILHTTDGGATWTRQLDYMPPIMGLGSGVLNSIACTDDEHAVAVGWDGSGTEIFRTTNGGTTWTRLAKPSAWGIKLGDVVFANATRGWAVGGDTVIETTDGGKTWTEQNVGSHSALNAISFVNSALNAISFVSPTHGWVAGQGGSILTTATGGGRP
jgi:photosystem II stability/assembly factor-like uncharacterized protein